MKINPLVQPIKVQNTDAKLSGKTIHLGDFLKGQVVSSDGKNLSLNVDGQLVSLLNQSGKELPVGETVTLEIKGFEGQVPLAEVLIDQPVDVEETEVFKQVFQGLKLPATEENLKMVQSMLDLKVPLTEENIKAVKTAFASLKMLVSQESGKDSGQVKLDVPIKDAVIAFIKGESVPEVKSGSQSIQEQVLEGSESGSGERVLTGETDQNARTQNFDATSEQLGSKSEGLQGAKILDQAIIQKSDQTVSEKPVEAASKEDVVTVLKDMVDQGDVEKLTMLLKSKMPLNLKNTMLTEQVVFGKKTVTNSVQKLEGLINALKDAGVLDKLPRGLLDKMDQPLELLKVVEEELEGKLLPKEVEVMKESLNNEVQFLRNAVQFVDDLNQEVGFVQIPLEMNDEIVNLDLYSSSSKKTSGSDEFSIFVSLDTQNLDKVQVSIKKYPEQVVLNFLLDNSELKERFEGASELLETGLETLGIGKFTVYYNERKEKKVLTDFLKSMHDHDGFDMKV